MLRRQVIAILIVAVASPAFALRAQTTAHHLIIDPQMSGLAADIDLTFVTDGNLIGDFHIDDNSEGTRTKPGLFGTFGPEENEPVAAALLPAISGSPDTEAAGQLVLLVDHDAATASFHDFFADLLANGPADVALNITVDFDSFRTRAPDSLYIGAALPLPIDSAALTALQLTQVGPGTGALQEEEDGVYSLTLNGDVELSGAIDLLGTVVDIPPMLVPLAFDGTLDLRGGAAELAATGPLEFVDGTDLDIPLPDFPLDLPTILPPGATAHLILQLTASSIDADVVGDVGIVAIHSDIHVGQCAETSEVDLVDYETIWSCLTGPIEAYRGGCICADANLDARVDMADIAVLQVDFGNL